MFFNAAEFTNYVIMKPNLPNVLARVYLVVLHNLSGVTLNNDDLSMGGENCYKLHLARCK